jgi:hypothetical protein
MADLYRAMGRVRDEAGEYTIALGGVRTTYQWAQDDINALPSGGFEDIWIESATWERVPLAPERTER